MAKKKQELMRRVDEKRLELLRLKQEQLAALRRVPDDALLREIEEVAQRLRAYEAPPSPVELPKGIVHIGKKSADGSVIRI